MIPSATPYALDRVMEILDMMIENVSIETVKKENIISLLKNKINERAIVSLAELFRQKGLVSDDKVPLIEVFDTYLQTEFLDRQFGELAIANGMATRLNVKDALEYQEAYFKKHHIIIKIGENLVMDKIISPSGRISILLTQNRIEACDLMDALNEMGDTTNEKDMVNKRFGVLAVKQELVTVAQVNEALKIRNEEREQKGKTRFISQILKETAGLSDDAIAQVLIAQKQIEKRRLDLEQALYTAKSEMKICKNMVKLFEYTILNNGLEASVKKINETRDPVSFYEFLIWLKKAGIKFGIVNDAVLEEFILKEKKGSKIIVARGYPPTPGTSDEVKFYFEDESLEKMPPLEKEAEKKTDTPRLFEKDSLLARIIPEDRGKPGKDVFGNPIRLKKQDQCALNAGTGVIQKGLEFFALIRGCPVVRNGLSLVMEPEAGKARVYTINTDIVNDTLGTYESASVELYGTILPAAVLRCHSLRLHGSLQGSVISTHDVEVRGDAGMMKKPKDSDAIRQTRIICHGPVKISRSITNSDIQTADALLAFNSLVAGSRIIAFKGMAVKDVLKTEYGPSVLWLGVRPGEKIIAVDQTLEAKRMQLAVLKKEDEIKSLTSVYHKEIKEAKIHLAEQAVLKSLKEIINAPELYQYEGLEGKIRYLKQLPSFSSVKACYLKLPETGDDAAFADQILTTVKRMPIEKALDHIKAGIDKEDETPMSKIEAIEARFKADLTALEQEAAARPDEIEQLETEAQRLQSLKEKLGIPQVSAPPLPAPSIRIRNRIEKGTIIKGRVAKLVLEEDLYDVEFKEIIDPVTRLAAIASKI